eukprot:1159227-Pelagomonas_calceolata.AAC.6
MCKCAPTSLPHQKVGWPPPTPTHPPALVVVCGVDEHAADVTHQHGLFRSGEALEHLFMLPAVCLCLALQQHRLVNLALLCQTLCLLTCICRDKRHRGKAHTKVYVQAGHSRPGSAHMQLQI